MLSIDRFIYFRWRQWLLIIPLIEFLHISQIDFLRVLCFERDYFWRAHGIQISFLSFNTLFRGHSTERGALRRQLSDFGLCAIQSMGKHIRTVGVKNRGHWVTCCFAHQLDLVFTLRIHEREHFEFRHNLFHPFIDDYSSLRQPIAKKTSLKLQVFVLTEKLLFNTILFLPCNQSEFVGSNLLFYLPSLFFH